MNKSKMDIKKIHTKIPFGAYSFDTRKDLSKTLLERNTNHVPCIVGFTPELSKRLKLTSNDLRILVDSSLTIIEVLLVIRKRIDLKQEESCFLFVNNTLVPSSWTLSYLYSKFKRRDGFLYLDLRMMETFG